MAERKKCAIIKVSNKCRRTAEKRTDMADKEMLKKTKNTKNDNYLKTPGGVELSDNELDGIAGGVRYHQSDEDSRMDMATGNMKGSK